jgi:hypothetical protein
MKDHFECGRWHTTTPKAKKIATKNLGEPHGPSAFTTGRQFCMLLLAAPLL